MLPRKLGLKQTWPDLSINRIKLSKAYQGKHASITDSYMAKQLRIYIKKWNWHHPLLIEPENRRSTTVHSNLIGNPRKFKKTPYFNKINCIHNFKKQEHKHIIRHWQQHSAFLSFSDYSLLSVTPAAIYIHWSLTKQSTHSFLISRLARFSGPFL